MSITACMAKTLSLLELKVMCFELVETHVDAIRAGRNCSAVRGDGGDSGGQMDVHNARKRSVDCQKVAICMDNLPTIGPDVHASGSQDGPENISQGNASRRIRRFQSEISKEDRGEVSDLFPRRRDYMIGEITAERSC